MHDATELMINPCFPRGANFLCLLLDRPSSLANYFTDEVVLCNFLFSVQFFTHGVDGLLATERVPHF